VNANPYVGSEGLTEGLAATGRTYEQFIAGLVRAALALHPRIPQFPTVPPALGGATVKLS
jgi:hypothetical protein